MINEFYLTIAIIICVATDVLMNFLVVVFVRRLTLRHGLTLDLMKMSNKALKTLPEGLGKSISGAIGYYQGKAVKKAEEGMHQADGMMGEVKAILDTLENLRSPDGLNQAPCSSHNEEYEFERRL